MKSDGCSWSQAGSIIFPLRKAFQDYDNFHIRMAELVEVVPAENKIITTEKDAVRLMKFEAELNDLPLYVLPVEHFFLFEEGPLFEAGVVNFIENFSRIK